MPSVFDDEEPSIAESMAPGSEDDAPHARQAPPRVTEVTLPTKVDLEDGYIYERILGG